MKKISILLFVLILTVMSCGYEKEEQSAQKNDVFTDEFFLDVVEIRDSRYGQVSGIEMESIISFMKSLELSPTEEHLYTENEEDEQFYGLDCISFIKEDGSEIQFLRNHATLSGVDGCSYVVGDINLNTELESIFNQE